MPLRTREALRRLAPVRGSRLGLALLVILAVLGVPAATPLVSAETQPSLPFESTHTSESCDLVSSTAMAENCDITTSASAATGAVTTMTRLVSPLDGTGVWKASAGGYADVVATYRLTEPVPTLHFDITIRINEARVTLGGGPTMQLPGWLGDRQSSYQKNVIESQLGHTGLIDAGAMALHSACSDCGDGTDKVILHTWQPGTVTTSGQVVVLHLKVHGAGGKNLPPGVVTLRAGIGSTIWQGNSWGDDVASVDAVVRSISLKP